MKLVQLLAKELKEWPEGVGKVMQDFDMEIRFFDLSGDQMTLLDFYIDELASDACDEIIFSGGGVEITKSQWQAERKKMNKPKWIRHRGGNQPVEDSVKVEYRMRDGDISTQPEYAATLRWSHWSSEGDIMAYRIIEETKDQEIEEVIPKHMAFGYASKEEMVAQIGEECPFAQVASTAEKTNFGTITYNLEIDATEATKEIDSLVAKWGQIESPLKWRDAIIHCQAIIEDCEREIERNVSLLDAEGLMMQKDSKKAMQHYQTDIDMSDWRNWENGDIIEVIKESETSNAKAGLYTITGFDSDHPKIELDERYFPEYANMKFVRRP